MMIGEKDRALVMPQTHSVKFTYEDYQLFPDDGKRHEIIEGDHYVTPSPRTRHQVVSGNLHLVLGSFVRKHSLGRVFSAPFDVVLSDQDIVQPDLLFVSSEHSDVITEKNIRGRPDLVIEILSETTRKTDEIIKRKLYERFGVREYWIVDPELEVVRVHRRTEKGFAPAAELAQERGDSLSTTLLPGLTIPLSEIFA